MHIYLNGPETDRLDVARRRASFIPNSFPNGLLSRAPSFSDHRRDSLFAKGIR